MRLFMAFMLLLVVCVSAKAEDVFFRKVSLTISPLHLFNPELYLTGEFRLNAKMSAATNLGVGRITDEGKTGNIREVGGQIRYYLLGTFSHGMMMGAEIGYVDVDAPVENPIAYLVGLHAGGFLGYKFSMKAGFTAELYLGPIYLWGETDDTSEWQTLTALKIGWSF